MDSQIVRTLINTLKIDKNELIKLLQGDKLFDLYEIHDELEKRMATLEYKLKEIL